MDIDQRITDAVSAIFNELPLAKLKQCLEENERIKRELTELRGAYSILSSRIMVLENVRKKEEGDGK